MREVRVYEVILSHPDEPQDGYLCRVQGRTPGAVQDECNGAVQESGGLWEGYQFTIWPEPVDV